MMHLACAVCGTPVAVPALHAWSFDAPLCSAECASRLPPRPAPTPAAAAESAFEALREVIHGLNRLEDALRRAAVAQQAEARDRRGSQRATAATILAGGGILGAIVASTVTGPDGYEAVYEAVSDERWAIEESIRLAFRASMAAVALGAPLIELMRPLLEASAPSVDDDLATWKRDSVRLFGEVSNLGNAIDRWKRAGYPS
ncbi:MAG: hypothetical protein R3B99_37440 [Polyangiales bacterium]